jgi:outer membrane lipoprotein-sorting protein
MATITTRIYWKNSNVRVEQYGLDGAIVHIQNGNTMFAYQPETRQAMKGTVQSKMTVVDMLRKEGETAAKKGTKVGTATIAGVRCDIVSIPIKKGIRAQSEKAYISTDKRLPLVMRTETVIGSKSIVSEIKSIKLGYNVPDAEFVLPKGTKMVVPKTQGAMPKSGRLPKSQRTK